MPSPNNNSQPPLRDLQWSLSHPGYFLRMVLPHASTVLTRTHTEFSVSSLLQPSYVVHTSSDDDEHNTDSNFLLLFADVDIAPALLAGLSEVDVLRIALGCRFALDIFHDFTAIFPYTCSRATTSRRWTRNLALRFGATPDRLWPWRPGYLDSARGKVLTLQTAVCVVRPCGYTVAIADTLCSRAPALSALKGYSLSPQHNCSSASVLLLAAALADSLLTQVGLVLSWASALCSTSSGRLTWQVTVSTVSLLAHITARCSIPISVFVFCTFRFEQRWNEDESSSVHRETVAFTKGVEPGLLEKQQRQQRRQQQSYVNTSEGQSPTTEKKRILREDRTWTMSGEDIIRDSHLQVCLLRFDTMIDVTVKKRDQRIAMLRFQYWERWSVQNPKINWKENSRVRIGRNAFTAEASTLQNCAIFVKSEDHKRYTLVQKEDKHFFYNGRCTICFDNSASEAKVIRDTKKSRKANHQVHWRPEQHVKETEFTCPQRWHEFWQTKSKPSSCTSLYAWRMRCKSCQRKWKKSCSQDNLSLEKTRCNTPKYLRAQEVRRFKHASGNRK